MHVVGADRPRTPPGAPHAPHPVHPSGRRGAVRLAPLLDGNRQFTVFAPTDAALVEAAGVATEDEVIPTLLKGTKIPVEVSGDMVHLDGATCQASVDVDNGVIHVIDAVMLPF